MLLNDAQIIELCKNHAMLVPFNAYQISMDQDMKRHVSHGISSFGYDITLGSTFKSYISSDHVLDPLHVTESDVVTCEHPDGDELLLAPGAFVLAHSKETFNMPDNVLGLVTDKSTYARCGITVQNTTIEPGWSGVLTLEIVNHSPRPVRLHVGQGIAQILFVAGDKPNVTYKDRNGKYQNQVGVTLPR